jgi:hypothetical protein
LPKVILFEKFFERSIFFVQTPDFKLFEFDVTSQLKTSTAKELKAKRSKEVANKDCIEFSI